MEATKAILVVEDDSRAREAISLALAIAGYRVATARDGREALDYLRQNGPVCLILLDLLMPGMDGAEFRREQLKDPKLARIPVVLLSGADQVQAEAEALGASGFVRKPVEPVPLLATIHGFACPQEPAVLLVASKDDLTDLVIAALRQRGFDVYQAASAPEAVALFRRQQGSVALVLVDLRVKSCDGLQLLTELRQVNPGVPCCVLNQQSTPYSADQLKEAGASFIFPGMGEAAQLFRQLAWPE